MGPHTLLLLIVDTIISLVKLNGTLRSFEALITLLFTHSKVRMRLLPHCSVKRESGLIRIAVPIANKLEATPEVLIRYLNDIMFPHDVNVINIGFCGVLKSATEPRALFRSISMSFSLTSHCISIHPKRALSSALKVVIKSALHYVLIIL